MTDNLFNHPTANQPFDGELESTTGSTTPVDALATILWLIALMVLACSPAIVIHTWQVLL